MDKSILAELKKQLMCSDLVECDVLRITLIKEIESYIYLEIDGYFIYIDDHLDANFLILKYINDKEESLKKGIMTKRDTEYTLENLIAFKNALYNKFRLNDYYQILFLKFIV